MFWEAVEQGGQEMKAGVVERVFGEVLDLLIDPWRVGNDEVEPLIRPDDFKGGGLLLRDEANFDATIEIEPGGVEVGAGDGVGIDVGGDDQASSILRGAKLNQTGASPDFHDRFIFYGVGRSDQFAQAGCVVGLPEDGFELRDAAGKIFDGPPRGDGLVGGVGFGGRRGAGEASREGGQQRQ
jgi:hypothetical protein